MKKKLLMLAAWALLGTSTAMAQVADGDYYLYDTATKSYLSRGSAWGTKAVTNKVCGIWLTWNATEGTITFKDNNLRLFKTNDNFVYTDNTSNSTGWTLTAADGGYTIRYGAEGKFLGHGDGSLDIELKDNANDAIVWQFLTADEYKSMLKAQTGETYKNIIDSCGFTFGAEEFLEQVSKTFINKDMTERVPTATFTGSKGTWTWNQERSQDGQPAYGNGFAEFYQATGSFHQTITVPSGLYRVKISGFERTTENDKCTTMGDAGYEPVTATFEANASAVPLASWYSGQTGGNNPNSTGEAVAKFNEGKYMNELYTYVGKDEQLTLRVNIPSHVGGRWVLINNVVLTQLTELSDADVTALLATVPEGYMEKRIEETLATAKAALETEKSVANYNALAAAIATAKESIEAYEIAKSTIVAAEAFLKLNNFATAEAIEAYNTELKKIADGYQAQTLTTAEAKNSKSTFNFSVSGWHSNSGIVGDLMTSAWNFSKDSWTESAYINNWSAEGENDGSEFKVPFIEAFVAGGDLSARTLTATLERLTANAKYQVNVWARVETTTNDTPVAEKIMLKVGEGTPVDIAQGEKIGESKLYHKHFSAIGRANADGQLNVSIDLAEGSNVHWLSLKDVNYEVIPVEEVIYNFNDSTTLKVSADNSTDGDITIEKEFIVDDNKLTISVNRSTTNTPNRVWNSKTDGTVVPQLRVYGGSVMISAPEGKALTSVNIGIDQSKWTKDSNTLNGEVAAESKWSGNSTNLVLRVNSQVRIDKITATLEDADENTTTYVPQATDLADVKAMPFNTEVAVKLDTAVVTLYGGKAGVMYSFMEDKKGAITLDMNLSNLEIVGQNAALCGTLNAIVSYDPDLGYQLGLSENTGTSEATALEKDSVVEAAAVTIDKLVKNPSNYLAKYIKLENMKFVTIEPEDWWDEPTYKLATEKDTIAFFDQYYVFGWEMPKFDTFKSVNGYLASYLGDLEFRPWGAYEATIVPAIAVENLAALKDIADGTDVKVTLKNAKVTVYTTGHMGTECYIEDETGAVKLNGGRGGWWSLDPEATDLLTAMGIEGDSVQFDGTLYANLTNSEGTLALSLNDSTQLSTIEKTENVDVTPTTLTIPEAQEKVVRYSMCLVAFDNVRFYQKEYDMSIVNGEDTLGVYDMFGTFYDEEMMPFTPDQNTDFRVVGILMDLGEGFGTCILPLNYIDMQTVGIKNVTNAEELMKGKVWNINGMRVNSDAKNLKKGVYIINGKKVVVK